MRTHPFQEYVKHSSIIILLLSLLITFSQIAAQQEVPLIQCGAEIEAEIGTKESNKGGHYYTLAVRPGDSLDVTVIPIGNSFDAALQLNDGGAGQSANETRAGETEQLHNVIVSSTNPRLQIFSPYGYTGAYTLKLGCTLRDGTVINPGDTLSNDSSFGTTNGLPPVFSGVGFPGLAPVDFSTVAKIPLPAGIAMSGAVTPTGGEILGYTLDASAGDTLDLTFTRLSGNLNLGLVVLSADNKVVFQASLVTSTTLNSRFTLPSAGQYTIGVFRIDLLPPDAPEATAFQIEGALNP